MENEIIKENQWSQTINLTTIQKERARADNSFALKLFRIVSKEPRNNVFISPMSLNMVLVYIPFQTDPPIPDNTDPSIPVILTPLFR